MTILVDANILLRSIQKEHPHHDVAVAVVTTLDTGGHNLVVVPQCLYEFWVVATRPLAQNGLGLDAGAVANEFDRICAIRDLLHDDEGVFHAWRDLVTRYRVQGKPAHDARLVAAMLRHGVTHLLTFNALDFARYVEVTALAPAAAVSFPPTA
jgi:predicted nucleic acid-binding protein